MMKYYGNRPRTSLLLNLKSNMCLSNRFGNIFNTLRLNLHNNGLISVGSSC